MSNTYKNYRWGRALEIYVSVKKIQKYSETVENVWKYIELMKRHPLVTKYMSDPSKWPFSKASLVVSKEWILNHYKTLIYAHIYALQTFKIWIN